MKNRTVERLKIAAKQYHRTRRGDYFENGIRIFHRYERGDSASLSWWDDVTFVLNDYRVALTWIHPRMVFEDKIDEEADRLTADRPYPNMHRPSTLIYIKVGKSRKKIHLWEQGLANRSDWYAQWTRVRHDVMQTADYQIEPSLSSRWGKCSRLVTLCAPVEVRSVDELRDLAALAKRLLKREVSLQEVFPNYRYTRTDWEREGLHLTQTDLHAHQVAP